MADWLLDRLAVEKIGFVASHPGWSQRFGIDGSISIRCIAHHPKSEKRVRLADGRRWFPTHYELMYLFIVIESYDRNPIFEAMGDLSKILLLRDSVREILDREPDLRALPVDIVFVPKLQKEINRAAMFGVISDGQSVVEVKRPAHYAEYINDKRAPPELKNPPIKYISVAHDGRARDYFHWWTRSYLSPQLAVSDLDWICDLRKSNDRRSLIVELKKSNVGKWIPYADDTANFLVYDAVCSAFRPCRFVVVHYSEMVRGQLGVFLIRGLAESKARSEGVSLTLADNRSVFDQISDLIPAKIESKMEKSETKDLRV